MTRYTSATDSDREAMLAEIGVASIEELFAEIPPSLRLGRALELPAGLGEASTPAASVTLSRYPASVGFSPAASTSSS